MNLKSKVLTGGILTVPQISAAQIIYLDFDGELTSYNGEVLTIDSVTVEDSGLTEERIAQITQALNDRFAGQNVLFVSDKSDLSDKSDYSTIFVGKTSAFEPYGSFAGLAETVDSGNKIHNDNAFVILDSLSSDERIADVIAHEAGHMLGTLDHGGEGLEKYAATYYVSSGETAIGMVLDGYQVVVRSGGTANGTTVNSGGDLYGDGVANNTVVNSSGSLRFGTTGKANGAIINSGGTMELSGSANDIKLRTGGWLVISNSGSAGNISFLGGAISYAVSGGIMSIGDNITFSGNHHCAVSNALGTMTIGKSALFLSNTIYNYWGGAAIGNWVGYMSIGEGAVFSANYNGSEGGVITNGEGCVEIGDSAVFAGNSTGERGGVIYNMQSGQISIGDHVSFNANYAVGDGGVICNCTYYDAPIKKIGDYASFSANSAGGCGGALWIRQSSLLNIGGDVLFASNYACCSGGAVFFDGGGTKIIGAHAVFSANSAGVCGGAIHNGSFWGELNLGNCTIFRDNSAVFGGAIFGGGGTTLGNSASFSGNSAASCGGAIHVASSYFYVGADATFTRNSAGSSGGAICGNASCGNNIVFSGNSASSGGAVFGGANIGENVLFAYNSACEGGAYYCNQDFGATGVTTVNGFAVFSGNYAFQNGGAIFNIRVGRYEPTNIGGSAVFALNSAGNNGGAVYNGQNGSMKIWDNAVFSGNSAGGDGGAVYNCSGGTSYISRGTIVFSGNSAGGDGGAILNAGSMTFSENGAVFSGNSAIHGGAVYNDGWISLYSSAVFSANSAFSNGGAVCNSASVYISDGAMFTGNTAGYRGGAFYNEGYTRLGNGIVFSGNTAASHGGAIFSLKGSVVIGDSASFCDNQARYGGAIYNGGSMNLGDFAVFSCNSGAICNGSSGQLTAGSSAVFSGNYVSGNGTITNGGSIRIGQKALFSGNTAGNGGAFFNHGIRASIDQGAVFSGNSATGNGGAILNYGTDEVNSGMSIGSGAVFSGNSAGRYGGAVFNTSAGKLSLSSVVFSSNCAGSRGGAIYNTADMTLNGARFETVSDTVWNTGTMTFTGTVYLASQLYTTGTITADHADLILDLSPYTNADSVTMISDISKISSAESWSVQVDPEQEQGIYKLAGNAADFSSDITLTVNGGETGKFTYAKGKYNLLNLGDEVYKLFLDADNNLCLKVGPDNMSIDYSIDSIGQIAYYDGEVPEKYADSLSVVQIPYTASAQITFDKDVCDGEYEFVSVIPEIEGAEQKFKIQVIDGVPVYLSDRENVCYYGTKVSETATEAVWQIAGISDYVLTDTLASDMTVTPVYGSLITTGLVLAGAVSLLVGCSDQEVSIDAGECDANKDGFYLKFEITYRDDYGKDMYRITAVPNANDNTKSTVTVRAYENDKTVTMTLDSFKYREQELTITISDRDSSLGYDLSFSFVEKNKEGQNKEGQNKEGRFGTLYKTDKSGKKQEIANRYEITKISPKKSFWDMEFFTEQKMHCWIAVAVNMLWAGGYLDTSTSVQDYFEALSSRCYKADGNKSLSGNEFNIFTALGINTKQYAYYKVENSSKTHDVFADFSKKEKGSVASISFRYKYKTGETEKHVITCFSIKEINKETFEIRYADSDRDISLSTIKETRIRRISGKWVIEHDGKSKTVTGFATLVGNTTDEKKKLDSINWKKVVELNAKTRASQASGTTVNGASVTVNGSITGAVVMDGGSLIIAGGALAEQITVHDGGNVNLKSGSSVSGKITTYGGLITAESEIAFNEVNFDFNITEKDGSSEVMLDNIQNTVTADFSVTLIDEQAAGTYALAGGASGFSGKVTVIGESGDSYSLKPGFSAGELGSLGVGDSLKVGNQIYSLSVTDDILCFNIAYTPRSVLSVESDIICMTKGTVTLTAVYSDDIAAKEFSFDGKQWETYADGVTVTRNGLVYFRGADAGGIYSEIVSYEVNNILEIHNGGGQEGLAFSASGTVHTVSLSSDNFETSMGLTVDGDKLDFHGLNSGNYCWRYFAADGDGWCEGNDFSAEKSSPAMLLQSVKNDVSDLFFAKGSEVWTSGYAAEHVGCGSWSGTGEQVELAGRNQITDVFVGSADANILVMTDDENGDALFVDDVYSEFPDEQQARLAQIDEIRAGAGDDIVDMTSRRFAYSGDGLVIRGGDGCDTIWANSGDNKLFGDAGNDRIVGASGDDVIVGGTGNDSMHGGGGDDIFCFCKGWGTDTAEQLSTGSVTLWFADNSGFWDQSTMTYTQGDNTVKVSGVTQVTLKYGDDDSELYDALVATGCFMTETSGKIWEEDGEGIIASL